MAYFGFTSAPSTGGVVPPGSSSALAPADRWAGVEIDSDCRILLPESSPTPSTPADALIISDLHLGSENCQAKALCQFLEQVLEGSLPTMRLIINGDVFDSIDFRRLKKTHWKVLSLIRHLSDKIEVIWIAGNHDGSAEIVSHLLGVTVLDEYVLHSGDRRILAVHGHAFDRFINHHPFITWVADCIYAGLQKIDRSHYVARLAKRKSKTFLHCVEKIEKGAVHLAHQRRCHMVLCGHTHHAVAKIDQEIPYYNSGCWVERHTTTYLTVADGSVQLNHYDPVAEPATVAAA